MNKLLWFLELLMKYINMFHLRKGTQGARSSKSL